MPAAGGSMSIPACFMTVGIDPREAMPIASQAVQSRAMPVVPGRADFRLDMLLHRKSLAAL